MRRSGVRSDAASCAKDRKDDHDWGYTSPNASPTPSSVASKAQITVPGPAAGIAQSPNPNSITIPTTIPTASPYARSLRHEESGLRGLVLSVPGRDIPATSPAPSQATSPTASPGASQTTIPGA